ncbi:MAG: hypothetical protein QW331_03725 [Candidatus Woesearchaeota archaeon]
MRVNDNIIKDVVVELAGSDTIPLVMALKGKKNISEFKLAQDIKREVNETRNILYRLYHHNLVSFIRKKDKQKGWYIYYWTFEDNKVPYLSQDIKRKKLEKLYARLEREKSDDFYMCPNQCIRLDFDKAVNFNYKCPECGSIIEKEDNRKKISSIEQEIEKIKHELANPQLAVKFAKERMQQLMLAKTIEIGEEIDKKVQKKKSIKKKQRLKPWKEVKKKIVSKQIKRKVSKPTSKLSRIIKTLSRKRR